DLFNIDGGYYAMEIGGGNQVPDIKTSNSNFSTITDQSNVSDNESTEVLRENDVFDGTQHGSNEHYLISSTDIFSGNPGAIDDMSDTTGISGKEYKSITYGGAELYLITQDGYVYSSSDGSNWSVVDSDAIDQEPRKSSAAVVTIESKEYLIVGVEDGGYYELNITDATNDVVTPTETVDTDTANNFAAKYPELASATVFDVYPSADTPGEFYLGTENGLWKRTSNGEFQRQ
ncbi:MAG: hypothetical protein ACOC7X_01155, partial [Spirochaetota bacterium]